MTKSYRLTASYLWQNDIASLQHSSTDESQLDTYDFLAVNITAQTLNDDASMRVLAAIVEAIPGIAAKRCFEVNEESVLANRDALIAFMEPLRERGCRFALDNFGASLPSYQYLVGLPFEYIKIDGSFVHDSGNKEMQMSFLRSTNEVAQLLGARTVAMHVESEAAHERMMALGVHFCAGLLLWATATN
jgi:EAL domain-containing protein (putative c-di-GMP-specific phosphodiesterase class I)